MAKRKKPQMVVSYYDREKGEKVTIDIPADVLEVRIPAQPQYCGQPEWHLPALVVSVNTDALQVYHDGYNIVAGWQYTELLSEAGVL